MCSDLSQDAVSQKVRGVFLSATVLIPGLRGRHTCTDADSVQMKSCRENTREAEQTFTEILHYMRGYVTSHCIILALIPPDARSPCSAAWLKGLRGTSR